MLRAVFPLSCARVRAHTAFRDCAQTYYDEAIFSVGKWGKSFLDLLKQGFLTRGAGLMNEKWDICGRDDLFFLFMGCCTNVSHF